MGVLGNLTKNLLTKTYEINPKFNPDMLYPYRGHLLYTGHIYTIGQRYVGYIPAMDIIQYMNMNPHAVELNVLDHILSELLVIVINSDSAKLSMYDPLQMYFKVLTHYDNLAVTTAYRTIEIMYNESVDNEGYKMRALPLAKVDVRKIYPENVLDEYFGVSDGETSDTHPY